MSRFSNKPSEGEDWWKDRRISEAAGKRERGGVFPHLQFKKRTKMIHIGSYIHRNELDNLLWRWIHDRVEPGDAELVTRLIHFNNTFVSRYMELWSMQLFGAVSKCRPQSVVISTKAQLKDALVSYPHYRNAHIDELIRAYIDHRENYFIETPIHAKLFFSGEEMSHKLVGANRIKRTRRLAEKSARRLVDFIFDEIKQEAEHLADKRAEKLGVQRRDLLTTPDEMVREFEKAEQRIIDALREGRALKKRNTSPINDVAGQKIILETKDEYNLYDFLESRTRCDIVEIEPHHHEHYHATNLIIRARPNKEMLLVNPLNADLVQRMRARGLWQGDIEKEFREFVLGGEDEVYIEIIHSTYEDILESEIGRSMHEDRIIDQRKKQKYLGYLAQNVESLVHYLFKFASFPSKELHEVPIKVWRRYLPDHFDAILKELYGVIEPRID